MVYLALQHLSNGYIKSFKIEVDNYSKAREWVVNTLDLSITTSIHEACSDILSKYGIRVFLDKDYKLKAYCVDIQHQLDLEILSELPSPNTPKTPLVCKIKDIYFIVYN
jgi:hypothetical protein